jgi:hypothetical protein
MPQLQIQIVVQNAVDGSAQVYLGQANELQLRLTNQTGGPLTLTAGSPAAPPPAGGATAIQLDLRSLFADVTGQAGLQVACPGWTAQYFDDPQFPVWALAPDASLTWQASDSITVTVGNLTPTVTPSAYYATVDLFNLGGTYASNYTPVVVVSNPPSVHKNLLDVLGIDVTVNPGSSLDPKPRTINYVAITKNPNEPYENRVQLTLFNKSSSQPIVPPSAPPANPAFTLTFVPAAAPPGYFALTTPDDMVNFTQQTVSGTLGWTIGRLPGTPPRWLLTPTTKQILGTGTEAIAQFELGNVRTQLVNGPTLAYLQWSGVPGYDDGFATLLLQKEYAALEVDYLEVQPAQVDASSNPPATVTLRWKVRNSTLVQVDGVAAPVPGTGSAEVPVELSRTFVLTAYDTITHRIATATATLTVLPEITTRWTPVGSIMLFSGAVGDIPAGWSLCDGTRGTPDLRDVFVVGSGGTFGHNAADRSPKHRHGLADFKVTATLEEAGAHTHGMPSGWYARGLSCGKWAGIDTGGDSHARDQTQEAGKHTHRLFVDFASLLTGENDQPVLPDWYALCYVMLLDPRS